LTPAIQAEADSKMAFSLDKSVRLKVDETSLVSGPTLAIQSTYLDQDATAGIIPYAPTLGKFITAGNGTKDSQRLYSPARQLVLVGMQCVENRFSVHRTISS
jgi:hypothetical protein